MATCETHWDRCVAAVTAHAKSLDASARRKRWPLNRDRIPVLLASFVDQPAYYPEWRRELVNIGLRAIEEHQPQEPTHD